jgi:hypothetical protein
MLNPAITQNTSLFTSAPLRRRGVPLFGKEGQGRFSERYIFPVVDRFLRRTERFAGGEVYGKHPFF